MRIQLNSDGLFLGGVPSTGHGPVGASAKKTGGVVVQPSPLPRADDPL